MPSLDINSSITLNVARPNSNVVIYAKQFDKLSRTVEVSLVNGTDVWDPPQDCEIVVMCFKPDGTKAIFDVANSESYYDAEKTYALGDRVRQGNGIYSCNTAIIVPEAWNANHWTYIDTTTPAMSRAGTGKYILTLAEQALSAAGNVLVELSFYTSDVRATTLSFMVNVEKSVPDNATLESTDYFNVLTGLIQGLLGASTNPPIINPQNYLWQYWNVANNRYEDNQDGLSAQGAQGDQGPRGYGVDRTERVAAGINPPPNFITPGKADRYNMISENESVVGTFLVYHGANGIGSPDPGITDPQPVGTMPYVGDDNAYARADHRHAFDMSALFDAVYPIGSIYMSTNPTSPSTLFGGFWVKLMNRFLLGAGDIYSEREEGGETNHTLTVGEMPSHHHATYRSKTGAAGTVRNVPMGSSGDETVSSGTSDVGGGESHNNMPPYLAVYMGERISPYQYNHNMALVEGQFYDEDGDIYMCIQSTDGAVTDDLSDLIGTYVREEEYW